MTAALRLRTARNEGARYSRRIRRIKGALAGTAAFALAALAVYVAVSANRLPVSVLSGKEAESEKPRMAAPSFRGVDGQGRPFGISAQEATWEDASTVALVLPAAVGAFGENGRATAEAESGEYRILGRVLVLRGGVRLSADDAEKGKARHAEVETESVTVDLPKSFAYGDEGIAVRSDAGTLTAGAFRIYGAEERMLFDGGVTVTLRPEKAGDGR
jgi:hypothetical protein